MQEKPFATKQAYLGWDNVNEGLKNNKSATISVFATMGVGTIVMFGLLFAVMWKPSLVTLILALSIALSGVFSILQIRSLYKNADRLFAKIEY